MVTQFWLAMPEEQLYSILGYARVQTVWLCHSGRAALCACATLHIMLLLGHVLLAGERLLEEC